ncbi:MerR family transcriptional regulator [Actomonas aquatica]|uniref:MerR family transcriptional regulator n=1 Tax=Actomonas aquatica TaxID=2866162 RepID=A0ABZ1CAM9_9BACT|nr:MerR family transcriptional regulator [Opitutus sp. WL0086]WRQ88298.1 MerR family transcriptional regulator [Opitutus sp. WL0086]
MKTVRTVAAAHGLSRATLLYYDRIGLLRPFHRTAAGHRLYSAEDEARLARIRELRAAGLPLADIDAVLEPNPRYRSSLDEALHRRLEELNTEIAALRRQQHVILSLLKPETDSPPTRALTKERWVTILKASGMTDADCLRWHVEFERLSPEAHQDFLESLQIPAAEIAQIRARSRRPG